MSSVFRVANKLSRPRCLSSRRHGSCCTRCRGRTARFGRGRSRTDSHGRSGGRDRAQADACRAPSQALREEAACAGGRPSPNRPRDGRRRPRSRPGRASFPGPDVGHPDGPSLRVSESRSEEGRSGAEDRRARRDYGGPGVRAVGAGAVPYVLAGLGTVAHRTCSRRGASVSTSTTTSWTETWGSSTSSSRVGSRFRSRSTSTATSGWLGNSIVTTSST